MKPPVKIDDLMIKWDGDEFIDSLWFQVVSVIKKNLKTPFYHEFR